MIVGNELLLNGQAAVLEAQVIPSQAADLASSHARHGGHPIQGEEAVALAVN
jgi:hypothetical protein